MLISFYFGKFPGEGWLNHVVDLLRKHDAIFQNGCASLLSHQQWIRVPSSWPNFSSKVPILLTYVYLIITQRPLRHVSSHS